MSLLSSLAQNVLDLPRLDVSVLQSILGSGSGSTSNGGIEYDDQGVPLMFRDTHLASKITTSENLWYTNVPRYKFLYFVKFISATTTSDTINSSSNITDLSDTSFVVSSMDKPAIDFTTMELNQYNKKRIIHTGRRYHPINCEFWDTGNNVFYYMFQKYMNFYYGDSLNDDSSAWIKDVVSKKMNTGENGWGYVIPTDSTQTTDQFLDRIQIYEFQGGKYRCYELTNPKISTIRFDNLDYNDGRNLSKVRATLEYEGLVFYENEMDIQYNRDLITEAKLDIGSFYEPKRLMVSDAQLAFTPTVSFNNKSADTDYATQLSQSGIEEYRDNNQLGISNPTMSNVSGSLALNGSITNIIGDIISQNSGTIVQNNILSSGTTNTISRIISAVNGGIY